MIRSKTTAVSKAADAFNYIILIAVALTMLFPFVYILAVSFTDESVYVSGELVLLPPKWSLDAYRYVLSTDSFFHSFRSTAFITIVGTVLNLLFTTTFAYAVTKQELPGRRFLLLMALFTMLFSVGIVPNYLLVKELGLINSLWALILPGLTGAWSIFVLKSFFQSLPPSLEDSAQIDGCNDIQVFVRIIFPLSLPAIAAFSLFFAVGLWNTYFSGLLYIRDVTKWPLQVLLQQIVLEPNSSMVGDATQFDSEAKLPPETIKMAALMIVMLPILLVYPLLQKYFTKGVLLGSVKG